MSFSTDGIVITKLFLKTVFPVIVMVLPLAAKAPLPSKKLKKPEVFLVGTIHEMHFDAKHRYSLADLESQIRALKPDLICGEIEPEAFKQPMEGYFPPEQAFLAEMAQSWGVCYVPVDWRLDLATQEQAEARESEAVLKAREQLEAKMQAYLSSLKNDSFYDTLHHPKVMAFQDELWEKIIAPNPVSETAAGCWQERNQRAVVKGLAARGDARRIVFVFGSAHLPTLQRLLKKQGIQAQIAPRLFTPKGVQSVSPAVLARWKRNLDNLKSIREGKLTVSPDALAKARKRTSRVEGLELAIRVSGHQDRQGPAGVKTAKSSESQE